MEIKILEEKARRLVFEVNSDHGFCNALKHALLDVKGVTIATYLIDHPLIGRPKFIIETDTSVEPRDAVKKAVEKLKKEATDFKKEINKIK